MTSVFSEHERLAGASGGQHLSIRTKRDAVDLPSVLIQLDCFPASEGVVNHGGAVSEASCGGNPPSVRAEYNTSDGSIVLGPGLLLFTACCVPLALPVLPISGSTGRASGTHQNTTDSALA